MIYAAALCMTLAGRATAQDTTCTWDDPCAATYLNCAFGFCYCVDGWDVSANWDCGGSPGVPDTSTELAVITETNDADMCPEDENEGWLEIEISTDTFKSLEIKAGSSGQLRIAFSQAATLTANTTVRIDGVNGPVVFEVSKSAEVETQ
jgi:hypothetical protein